MGPCQGLELELGLACQQGMGHNMGPYQGEQENRAAIPNFAPLDRRPAESKDDLIKDEPEAEALSSLKKHNSTKGSLRKNNVTKI